MLIERMTAVDGLALDAKLAIRQLLRRPGFSLACILVLAIGLGANNAIFSLLYTAVLKPLPFPQPGQLVALHNRFPGLHLERLGASSLDYLDLREHHELFADVGAFYFLDLSRTRIAIPAKVNAVAMTSSLFHTLEVKPLIGRVFSPQEEHFGGPHAVILSESYWRNEFAADPHVLGRALRLNGELYPVVGVMPDAFRIPNDVTQMWVPVVFSPKQLAPAARGNHYLHVYARLAPGLTVQEASARLEQLSYRMSLEHPDDYPFERLGWRFFLLPMARDDDGSARRWITVLFAAVTFLLLIVAANVTGLLVVRATERQFESSMRMALGASRFRIARQVLAEVMLLAAIGGLAGLLIADAARHLLSKFGPTSTKSAHWAGPVFLFGFCLCLLVGVLCALYPAWTASRAEVNSGLKQGGHGKTADKARSRMRQMLIMAQVALATTLLICGGLFVRSLVRLLETPTGFDSHYVLTMEISLPVVRYKTAESRAQFYSEVVDRIQRLPGVEMASACTLLPFGWGDLANTFEIVGRPRGRVEPYASFNHVLPGYFDALRIPLLQGRTFTAADRAGSQPVVLVDHAMAERYFAHEDPIGQFVRMPSGKPLKIVGIVGSVKTSDLDIVSRPTLYFSALQVQSTDMSLVVRSAIPEATLATAVQKIVTRIDKDQPVYDVASLQSRIDASLRTRKFAVILILSFAGVGVLVAAIGLYGMLSFAVLVRRREIGVRVAVGADRARIGFLMFKIGLAPALFGVTVGCAVAAAVYRMIASQLYNTVIWDRTVWSAVLVFVLLACVISCALPVWRAMQFDLLIALRDE